MKTMIVILAILALGFGYLSLNQCSKIKDLKSELEDISSKTDTIYKSDTVRIPKPYAVYQKPEKVIVYEKIPEIRFQDLSLVSGGLLLSNQTDSLLLSDNFLKTFPFNSKLLNIDLTKSLIKISLLSTSGQYTTEHYNLDLEKYNYNYQYSGLTKKKKLVLSIKPYLGYQFRLLNKFHDLDLGLKFNTTRFNYNLGVNGFYYPSLKSEPGWDLKFGVMYNF